MTSSARRALRHPGGDRLRRAKSSDFAARPEPLKHGLASDEWRGLWRSLRVYHLDSDHTARWTRSIASSLGPDDLVFDIGAHVGDRTSSFRRLGARVVALEPQPGARLLRVLHGLDRNVTHRRNGSVGSRRRAHIFGQQPQPDGFHASPDFVAAANAGAKGWEGQVWDRKIQVQATTLDRLIGSMACRPS